MVVWTLIQSHLQLKYKALCGQRICWTICKVDTDGHCTTDTNHFFKFPHYLPRIHLLFRKRVSFLVQNNGHLIWKLPSTKKLKTLTLAIVNSYIFILKSILIDSSKIGSGRFIISDIDIHTQLRYHSFIIYSFGGPWFRDIDDIKPLYLAANGL